MHAHARPSASLRERFGAIAVALACLRPLAAHASGPAGSGIPVTNGVPDADDPGVVGLAAGGQISCTGTLIAPRVVLTAAHCLKHGVPDAVRVDATGPSDGRGIAVIAWRSHREYDRDTNANDIAVLYLGEPAEAATWPVVTDNQPPLAAGSELRIVGFGLSSIDMLTAPMKREGTAVVDAVVERTFSFGPSPSQPCVGDSGGPAFVTIGGTEYVAGVTSLGDGACDEWAIDTRVDAYVDDFIAPFLALAAQVDGEVGAPCLGPEACASGSCIEASDLPGVRYCSNECATNADCVGDMSCDAADAGTGFCRNPLPTPGAPGTSCTQDGDCELGLGHCLRTSETGTRQCARPCVPNAESSCGADQACNPIPDDEAPFACTPVATGGCGVGGHPSLPTTVALLLAWIASRRRRAGPSSAGRAAP